MDKKLRFLCDEILEDNSKTEIDAYVAWRPLSRAASVTVVLLEFTVSQHDGLDGSKMPVYQTQKTLQP